MNRTTMLAAAAFAWQASAQTTTMQVPSGSGTYPTIGQIVRLFSGCLKQEAQGVELYGSSCIHRTMEGFFDRGGRLSIMLENAIDLPSGGDVSNHPLVEVALQTLQKGSKSDLLQLRQAASDDINDLESTDYRHHWMVMDELAFRLEMDTIKYRAAVCFGRPEVAKALATIFDRMFERATPLI